MEETITNTKPDFLSGGGKMGQLIRSKDWSKTPLGVPDTWPQSLRTAVSLCIASNFPIDIVWGPHRVQIYNDGYWPITGDMHPNAMGQDFKECWLSAWPVIGQAFEEASLGQARFLENQHIFLDRYGYKEETFFTFSFSPILDESGEVGGLFHPVIELTQQTLAERRLNILRSVADNTLNARTVAKASSFIIECLKDFGQDLPFVLLYSMTADGKEAYLQGNSGVEKDSPLAPVKINLEVQHSDMWPLAEAIQNGKSIQVEDLETIFGTFNCNPYPEPPRQAIVFPINLLGTEQHNYFLIAGVSSRRSLDEKYLSFYELLSASVNNALTKAKAYEEERKKAEALAEIDKAKTVFFSNISHEFRTPLTLMLGPLEELLNKKNNSFSKTEKENIETTHRNAIRLLKLVNTLLDFSRIESGRIKAIFSLVDIVVLTKNLASNFRSIIEKAGLKLIVSADSIIQPVYVDKQMWEKIIFNLLSNAFKYTLAGEITVELLAENDFVVLKVKDTGVGIPENELSKMFERFHRVQNVTGRTYEGTGIGLSLIKELVQLHQGTVNVESKLHEGSVFTVKIPTGKKHISEHQISETAIDSDEISSTIYIDEIETLLETEKPSTLKIAGVKEKNILPTVLVVDDNADMREHISSILSNSYYVITANNGIDALYKMQETTPALVLSDIMMPVMDGMGLLKEIKSNKATANIPVIFLTARAGEESKIEGWETGADDYLVKPFSAKELVARVTAQIRMVKLRQSLEGNVRNLFMAAPAGIGVLRGPQHVLELANEMYLQMAGNRDIVGKSIREAFPELEGQGFYELLDKVYTTGEPFVGHGILAQLDTGNGQLKDVYLNFVYQPSHNNEGEINGILVHAVDVTELVLSRKKVEESENRFRTMADGLPVLIWTIDASGSSSYYNKTFRDFIGASKDEDISDWGKIVHPDDSQSTFDTINTAIAECRSYSLECRLLRADGQWRWVLIQSNARMGNNNEFVGFVGSSVDITERKLFEKELMEAKVTAENAAKYKQQFLSNMSHEIRTPLNSILGFAHVLLKTELDTKQTEFLQAIKTSGKSLNLLINDILDLAKVDAGKMTFEQQPFEIHPLITSILHTFDVKIKEKNLVLIKEYDRKIPSILLGDSLRLNQIILNLISNAVKFTHKGKITLSVKLLDDVDENVNIEFTVIDSGIGIAADKIKSIFNLFEQSELSIANSYGGTGLGLAIVKQLIEAQGGSISLKSKLGEGSTFSFILSFGKSIIKLEEEIEIPTLDSEIINLRVLVAEDVALNQLLIKIILNDFGFECEIVDNGKLAIEKMRTNTYDIILMDLQMPEMNGFEATEYIRKTLKSQIPIIALTANVTTVDVFKSKEFGMDDYISKPINEDLLYRKIIEFVKKKQ